MSKVVVITGASAGVGRATAELFARRGWKVGLLARGEERLADAAEAVRALGTQAIAIPTDVADAAAVERAAERIEYELGPIDVWVNNAMATVFAPVAKITPDEFRRGTEVTYLGQVHGTLSALKRMRRRNRGTIVNVGSALAYRAIPLQSVYCAAKYAVRGFTDSLRTEIIHDRLKVHLTMVHLPAMNTPQFDWVKSRLPNRAQPVPPIFQPEVGAEAVFYAAHNDCGPELLVAWPTIKAVVGEKFVDGYINRRLAKSGYASQQTGEPARARPDNLWEPAPGDWGAHGRFDDRARRFSLELWARTHREWLALGAAGALGILLGARSRRD